jgi:uncharacterized membrane protein
MKKQRLRHLAHAAIIAAMYAVLTYLQNLIFPNSTNMAIQFRASEALCILAFFTPAAIPGLSLGCLVANMLAGATPVDFVVGTLASFLAATFMWNTRHIAIKGYPLLGMLMPALANGIFVGWQLTVYFNVDVSFWVNALCVATGELAVLLVLGTLLFYAIRRRHLDKRLFY